ncbi:3'(2'),5'-bisphosphate nucleotidase CysQ [Actinophytocola oryzae]|uniref:inositol-phosphate phosphatase n=1 Tax=Actinophytocola oryzae TaxID=502181 RepID=A0A4R7VYD8_9PSEU|nr:3'(2'),5'-bisphosphate nucleotidase CysQ [Actinophytocola oryzae]TDV54237.1 3'(2'),5'-bisphosphate nucleotidase [Actinophytocola oryzae]
MSDTPVPTDDHVLARKLATAAAERLRRLRTSGSLSGAALGRAGDRLAHLLLTEELRTHRPTDAVLSEEDEDGVADRRPDRVWIVDPLDGTREYGEPDRADWAVHVALAVRGEPVVGAVALPADGVVLATDDPPRLVTRSSEGTRLRVAVSRSRPPALVARLCSVLDVELVPMGSAGAKTAAVLAGGVDAYVHAGGQYEWDSAAPVAVANAAGAHTSRVDGSPLVYDNPSAYLPDLLVCHPDHRDTLLTALAAVRD